MAVEHHGRVAVRAHRVDVLDRHLAGSARHVRCGGRGPRSTPRRRGAIHPEVRCRAQQQLRVDRLVSASCAQNLSTNLQVKHPHQLPDGPRARARSVRGTRWSTTNDPPELGPVAREEGCMPGGNCPVDRTVDQRSTSRPGRPPPWIRPRPGPAPPHAMPPGRRLHADLHAQSADPNARSAQAATSHP